MHVLGHVYTPPPRKVSVKGSFKELRSLNPDLQALSLDPWLTTTWTLKTYVDS